MNLSAVIIFVIIFVIIVLTSLFIYFVIIVTDNTPNTDTTDNLSLNPVNGYSLSYVNMLNVPDQGKLKSCGAVQISTLMSYYYYIQLNESNIFSPLYLYYYGRIIGGDNAYIDNGSTINNYLTSINTYGLTKESDWPYITSDFNKQPFDNITKYNPQLRWNTVDTNITNIKYSIKRGNPVLLDIILYESFSNINSSGLVLLPNITSEAYIAHHAISLWGWDDDYQAFIMLNSWGTNNGHNGWYFLPYQYLLSPSLSTHYVYNISFITQFTNM